MTPRHVTFDDHSAMFVTSVRVDGELVAATEYDLDRGYATIYAKHGASHLRDENGKPLTGRLYGRVEVEFDHERFMKAGGE